MKKLVLVLLILVAANSAYACSMKDKAGKHAAEAASEVGTGTGTTLPVAPVAG